jgi:4-amino-4-deoxy-L-arabinose transferase-like glycosyltransferase
MQEPASSYQKKIGGIIIGTVILKIILSFFFELGNDEVYYYTYAVQPDWNHFDHPGMVGWMIRVTTLNLKWVSELSMRIGAILAAAMATYIVFETGTLLKNARAGFIAAILYSLSIYTTIIAGLFVLPDSPQLLFFTASIYLMVKWVVKPHLFNWGNWLILGLLIGLATLSKIHGLYLWIGFGGFILFHQPKTLREKGLYGAIFLTAVLASAILYWNIHNDFITYQFHSKRVTHTGLSLDYFFQEIIGEFLYQNPLVYISCLIPLVKFSKLKKYFQSNNYNQNSKALYLLLWLSLPLIFTFWGLSLFNATLPHWTGPAFIALFLIAGVYWSEDSLRVPLLIKSAAGLLGALLLGFLLLVYIFPTQLGSSKMENLGEYNPINDVTGWQYFESKFASIVKKDIADGKMSKQAVIVTHKWFPAGHLLFYIANPLHMPLIAIGNLSDLHKFAWLNNEINHSLQLGNDAYCIVPSNLPADPQQLYGPYFKEIQKPDTIAIVTHGIILRNFYVYRLKNCIQRPPVVLPKK